MLDKELEKVLKEINARLDEEGMITVYSSDYTKRELEFLSENGLIKTNYLYEFDYWKCMIVPTHKGENYFKDKKTRRIKKIIEWAKWLILLGVSIATLLVAICK